MQYIFLYNSFLLELSCKFFLKYNLSRIYSNNILKLELPKLISSIESSFSENSSSVSRDQNGFRNKLNSKTNFLHKFDKKNKANVNSQDMLEIKKNKLRLNKSKKNRKSSVNIEQEDIFNDGSSRLFFGQQDLTVSSGKNHKVSKTKRKEKAKQEVTNNSNVEKDAFLMNEKECGFTDVINKVVIDTPLTIQELASKLNIPEAEIITYLFLKEGLSVTVNQVIDISIAQAVASSYNFSVTSVDTQNNFLLKGKDSPAESSANIQRSPIITIMGHVDHGKTTLLDSILETNFVCQERGGITQSISAYEIEYKSHLKSYKLIFLDTPGHEAFESMRVRGIQVTDIVLLVVAADDGLKPQTIECIEYIQRMNLFHIVVINKVDKNNINLVRIKEDLANYNIIAKEWGGEAIIVEVSALTRKNINLLLSEICLLSDRVNLFANPFELASGTILEAYIDKKQGSVANIIVQNGRLKLGDVIVSSNVYGKVKSIVSLQNLRLSSVGPSSVVKILGFYSVPQIGSEFNVVKDEKQAKEYCLKHSSNKSLKNTLKLLNNRITSSNISCIKQLKLIIKADTQGSLEAIINLISKLPQSKVQLNIIAANFGGISNSDIELALATNSFLIAFNINISSQIYHLIKQNSVVFDSFDVIYHLIDYVKDLMLKLIDPEYSKLFIGSAIVRTVFEVQKKFVAGCFVSEGKLKKKCYINVSRNENVIYEGYITSLKHLKDDVEEVFAGDECGLMCEYSSWQSFDNINAYELVEKKKSLE